MPFCGLRCPTGEEKNGPDPIANVFLYKVTAVNQIISCYPSSILLLSYDQGLFFPSNSLVMAFSLKQPFKTSSEFKAQLH